MHVCVCACMCVCMYVCTCVCMRTHNVNTYALCRCMHKSSNGLDLLYMIEQRCSGTCSIIFWGRKREDPTKCEGFLQMYAVWRHSADVCTCMQKSSNGLDHMRVCIGRVCRGRVCRGRVCRGRVCRGRVCRGRVCTGRVCRGQVCRGWPRLIACLELHVVFCNRATNYRALLRKMTYEDKASVDSTPPCRRVDDL